MASPNCSITTLVWGFDNQSTKNAILEMKKRNVITTAAWFGTAPECSHDVIDFFTGRYCHEKYHGSAKNEYQEIFDITIHQFMDLMSRHVFYAEKSFHDLLNIYNELYDLFSNILIEKKVDVILFSNLPHEGPDLILYHLAKEMGIPTILFYQSIFPGKFFYTYDLDDFGTFARISPKHPDEHFTILQKHEKDLFYMKNHLISHIPFSLQSGSMKSFLQSIFRPDLLSRVQKFQARHENGNEIMKKKCGDHDGIRSRAFSYLDRQMARCRRHSLAKKCFQSIVCKNADLKSNFVYFPLHLQPELTTSVLGGMYVDQILAIERLSLQLPEDWYIYVKENPKQTELMRGRWFFSRIRALGNVRLLDPGIDTYLLMERCKFVATITGTAGWEAITGGKNVLIFGHPWYQGLPGVFSFADSPGVNDILNYQIDHTELEEAVNYLLNKTGDGVIDENYASLVKDYNPEKNSVKIAEFIGELIKRGVP